MTKVSIDLPGKVFIQVASVVTPGERICYGQDSDKYLSRPRIRFGLENYLSHLNYSVSL